MTTFPLAVKWLHVVEIYRGLQSADPIDVAGRYLMGREVVGIPLRRRMEDIMLCAMGPTTYVLDFAGVADISASVAEELGPLLFTAALARGRPDNERYVVYANLSHDARLGFDDVFRRTEQVTLSVFQAHLNVESRADSRANQRISLLGAFVPKPLEDIVIRCYARGEITSTDLSEGSLAAASKKLAELYEGYPGLVHRVKIYGANGARSWHYVYLPVLAPDVYMSYLSMDGKKDETENVLFPAPEYSHHDR